MATSLEKLHQEIEKQIGEPKPAPSLPWTLEQKLAELVHHLLEVKAGHTMQDNMSVHYYLTDADLVNWVDRLNKAGMIRPRFITQIPR